MKNQTLNESFDESFQNRDTIEVGGKQIPIALGGAALFFAVGYVLSSGQWKRIQQPLSKLATELGRLTLTEVLESIREASNPSTENQNPSTENQNRTATGGA